MTMYSIGDWVRVNLGGFEEIGRITNIICSIGYVGYDISMLGGGICSIPHHHIKLAPTKLKFNTDEWTF